MIHAPVRNHQARGTGLAVFSPSPHDNPIQYRLHGYFAEAIDSQLVYRIGLVYRL